MNLRTLTAAAAILLLSASSCCNSSQKQEEKSSELQTSAQSTLVQTDKGQVAGYIDNGIYTYKGIPYAKAERFMAPQPGWRKKQQSVRTYSTTGQKNGMVQRRAGILIQLG